MSGATVDLTLDEVYALSREALIGCGTSEANAGPVADSMREAEAQGIHNVGLGYLPIYCEHARCGKVNGKARPTWSPAGSAAIKVDAHDGFAHPAFEIARPAFVEMTREAGVAAMGIARSSSAGVVGWFVEKLADQGLVSLAFANASPSMAPWGGTRAFFGTNPIAFGFPRANGPNVVVDQSTTATARVNVAEAAASGQPIPPGWAFDADGNDTTDAVAGLAGSMAPSGGYKGAAFALMVDVLAAGITGAHFSYQSSSFGDNQGGPTRVGQLFIAIAPDRFASGFGERIEAMLGAMTEEDGVRLPGDRRHAARVAAERDGVSIPAALHATLRGYCA